MASAKKKDWAITSAGTGLKFVLKKAPEQQPTCDKEENGVGADQNEDGEIIDNLTYKDLYEEIKLSNSNLKKQGSWKWREDERVRK